MSATPPKTDSKEKPPKTDSKESKSPPKSNSKEKNSVPGSPTQSQKSLAGETNKSQKSSKEGSKTSPKSSTASINQSPKSSKSSVNKSPRSSKTSVRRYKPIQDNEDLTAPDFIYGGPFIKQPKPTPFLEIACPVNIQQQGTFKKSYAYLTLKERLPIILTKVIDQLSRKGDGNTKSIMQNVTKLKNDLVTNKKYDKFTLDDAECNKWNEWIDGCDNAHYFNNALVFTECYVYRKLKEFYDLQKNNSDYFSGFKSTMFANNLEPMCVVAEKVVTMLEKSEKAQRKQDFIMLLKICLWANKMDMCHSLGEEVVLTMPPPPPPKKGKGKPKKGEPPPPPVPEDVGDKPPKLVDPIEMILLLKDKMLADDSGKAADNICNRADKMRAQIEKVLEEEAERLAAEAKAAKGKKGKAPPPPPLEEGAEPPPKPNPCPAKLTVPQMVAFDIVCDNAGYELFTDLCVAHFLVAQEIVEKVRFHLKKYPWYISGATKADLTDLINQCKSARYNKSFPSPPKPPTPEGEEQPPDPPRDVSSDAVNQLGRAWAEYVENGTFMILDEDYWTYPHPYNQMKKYDPLQYRKLQYAVGILFKGDLNFRKLVGDRNTNPYLGFEPALQGFMPAPIVSCRVVKSEVVAGCGKGKFDAAKKLGDENWMFKGLYGAINLCKKAEPFKPSDRPCFDYCDTCMGRGCPKHTDF